MTGKSRGQEAFEAYNASTGGKTWDGKPVPTWDAIQAATPHVCVAWRGRLQLMLWPPGSSWSSRLLLTRHSMSVLGVQPEKYPRIVEMVRASMPPALEYSNAFCHPVVFASGRTIAVLGVHQRGG